MLLMSISKTAPEHAVEDALASLWNLTLDFGSDIVQATQGMFNCQFTCFLSAFYLGVPVILCCDLGHHNLF